MAVSQQRLLYQNSGDLIWPEGYSLTAPVLDDLLRSLLPQTSYTARITRSQLALGGTHNTTEVGFYSRPENVEPCHA